MLDEKTMLLQALETENPQLHTLLHYSESYPSYIENLAKKSTSRCSPQLIEAICHQIREDGPFEVDYNVLTTQLHRFPCIATADHGGLLHFPLLVNSNILLSSIFASRGQPYIISLFTTKVPMDNISFPRGCYLGGRRLPFFSKRWYRYSLGQLPLGIDSGILGGLSSRVSPQEHQFFKHLFRDILGIDRYDSRVAFVKQLPSLNSRLFPLYFDPESRQGLPQLVPINADGVVASLLQRDLHDKKSLVHQLLFVSELRSSLLQELSGVAGCWSTSGGSQLFWRTRERGGLQPLVVRGNRLECADGWFCGLEPEEISEQLNEGSLVPGLFLDILLLSLSHGAMLLGGFNQLNYAQGMKQGLEVVLLHHGLFDFHQQVQRSIPNGLSCGPMPFGSKMGFDYLYSQFASEVNPRRGLTLEDIEDRISTSRLPALLESGLSTMAGIIF